MSSSRQVLRYAAHARTLLLGLALAGSLVWFARELHPHYPIQHWLFWVYARLWVWCSLFTLACVSTGTLIVQAAGGATLPLRERIVMILATGVLAFFALMFVGGLLGLYGGLFAVAMPLAAAAIGAIPTVRLVRRAFRHLRAHRSRARSARPWWHYPVLAFGAAGVALVYFSILSPKNIAFDSHFYHLGLAQQYAAEGAIRATVEGWTPAALPHLASVIYTWAFLIPGLNTFERITCAAHLEFVIFLFTLFSVPVLVRWLVPAARAGSSWAAFFLFPGIFVYDSTLSAAADHVNAFWAIPIFLALRRAYRAMKPRDCALLAAAMGGAALTKYQAMYLLAFPILAMICRAAWLIGKAAIRRRALAATARQVLRGLGTAAGVGLIVTSPHWLKNWVFYGDPLFPYLYKIFTPDRWVSDLGPLFEDWSAWQLNKWKPAGTTPERLKQTLEALVFFSFEPHDWPRFHGKVPVFGSLFTLSLVCLPFVRGARRTWMLALATLLGVLIWFWTMHQDRYLQSLLPWMVCTVAATIALAWRTHWTVRPLVAALVGLQIVWGGDAYFIPAHAMTRASAVDVSSDLIALGYQRKYEERFEVTGTLFQLGAQLPAGARVLLHENNPRLGLWRPVVADAAGWQYGIRYELFDGPQALDARLREYGVTHIVTRVRTSRMSDSLGADLRFFDYVEQYTRRVQVVGGYGLYEIPAEPVEAAPKQIVAYLGCGRQYERGLHEIQSMRIREAQVQERPPRVPALDPAPSRADALTGWLDRASYVVTDPRCRPAVPPSALGDFVEIAVRKNEHLWARRR